MSERADVIRELVDRARQNDGAWEELFDLVHAAVSLPASQINNSGSDEQIAYIAQAGCLIHVLDLLGLPADTSLPAAQEQAAEHVQTDDDLQLELDDLVHEIASRDGSAINNSDIEGQIAYLVAAGYEHTVRELLDQETQAT